MTAVADIPREKNGRVPYPEVSTSGSGVPQIPLALIDVGPNVRVTIEEVDELAESIRQVGVLQPIKVRADGDRYVVVWGQRRFLASQKAGLERIPALIEATPKTASETSIEQLQENLQRSDLNAIDEAKALRAVLDADPELTQEELAKRLGRSAPWVSNTLRLLEVAPGVQALVASGELTAAHVKAIAGLSSHKAQQEVAESAVRNGFSAKRVESEVAWRKQSDRNDVDRKAQMVKKGERLAKRMIKALEAESIPKDERLVLGSLWDVDEDTVRKAVRAAGWNASKRDGYGTYGYKPDEIGCDCKAYEWTTHPAAGWTRCCVSAEHVNAYQAKEKAQEDQRKKELRDKAKRLTAVLEKGLAGIDPTAARLAIAALAGRNLDQAMKTHGDPWPAVEAIADEKLAFELGEFIASRLITGDRWSRAESAELDKVVNKLAAATAKKGAAAE